MSEAAGVFQFMFQMTLLLPSGAGLACTAARFGASAKSDSIKLQPDVGNLVGRGCICHRYNTLNVSSSIKAQPVGESRLVEGTNQSINQSIRIP